MLRCLGGLLGLRGGDITSSYSYSAGGICDSTSAVSFVGPLFSRNIKSTTIPHHGHEPAPPPRSNFARTINSRQPLPRLRQLHHCWPNRRRLTILKVCLKLCRQPVNPPSWFQIRLPLPQRGSTQDLLSVSETYAQSISPTHPPAPTGSYARAVTSPSSALSWDQTVSLSR